MAIMMQLIILMPWYFFGAVYESVNADSNTSQLPHQKQRIALDEYRTEEYEIQGHKRKRDLADKLNGLKQHDSNNICKSANDIFVLADELYSVEDHFSVFDEYTNLRPFYQSLLNRINECAQNFIGDVDPYLYKTVLGFLYANTLSREHNFDDASVSKIILNMSYYLESVKRNIVTLKDLRISKAKGNIIDEEDETWKINFKLKEVIDTTLNEIIPQINNITNQTNAQMKLLLNEILYLEKETKDSQEEKHKVIHQKKEKLADLLMFQNSISILNIFGSAVGFVGPVGAAVVSVIKAGGTISEILIFNTPASVNGADTLTEIVPKLESLKEKIKVIRDHRVDDLKKSLQSISQETNKYPDIFSDISNELSKLKGRLDKISAEKMSSYHWNEIQDVEIELKAALQESFSATNRQTGNEILAIQNMQKVTRFSSAVLDAYNAHSSNQAKFDIIHDIIWQNEQSFFKLRQYEDKIYNTIVPMLQNIQTDIDNIVNNIAENSKVVIDVSKWMVKSTLKDVMGQIQQLTVEFRVLHRYKYFLENMREAGVLLINAYNHVQDFQKDLAIANFIADTKSISLSTTSLNHDAMRERKLKGTLTDLELMLSSSIIVQKYKKAIDAFKHFVFPYADEYLKYSPLPAHFVLDPNKNKHVLENTAIKAETAIEEIRSEYSYSSKAHQSCTGSGEFSSRGISSKPFFVWENAKHKKMISKLLSGESVTVKADITQSPSNMDALKFNDIKLRFTAKHERKQFKIDKAMKNFVISAIHLGNSYYRYNNKIYLMTTPSIKIWYSLAENKKGVPDSMNMVYVKLKKGDFMLSPYASWKIHLDENKGQSFRKLKKFRNQIHLELGGYGEYISKHTLSCSYINVDKYYKATDKHCTGD